MKSYDVVVIGSGPGGYVSAIRSAQLGFSTALIEKYNTLGGTCLNVGCIPSKALLDCSDRYEKFQNCESFGISIWGAISPDLKQMMAHKTSVIAQSNQGIEFLMKKNKIDVIQGKATFQTPKILQVDTQQGNSQNIEAKYFIIATGSKPIIPDFAPIDKQRIITSTEALSLTQIPEHLIVIGGGVIGLEIGQIYKRLGAKISILEYAPYILPTMDTSLSRELMKILKKQKINIYTNTQVNQVIREGQNIRVIATQQDSPIELQGDYCLVSIGRSPFTEGLGLENIGISINSKGQIPVNEHLQTQHSHIFAIGDVIHGPMLAHKAEEEGVFVAERIAQQKPEINYNLIPSVVYTHPEVATVGQSEEQLKTLNRAYKVGQFPFKALGRARASGQTDGFVKILADTHTDEILGVHIIGEKASELIAQAVTAMEFRASAEDIARICHAHPTFSEAMKEAALDASEKRAIHS